MFPSFLSSLQRLLIPRERGRPDAASALSPRRPAGPGNPSPRQADPHPEPRRGGVCRHHQHLHTPRLHGRQGLRQGVGHQPARKQEPHGPAGLSGETRGRKESRNTKVLKIEMGTHANIHVSVRERNVCMYSVFTELILFYLTCHI